MKYDVVIAGGGLNGAALAIALQRAGLLTCVIEAESATNHRQNGSDGRSYAIAAANQRMLEALGLWDDLSENAGPILDIKVTDGQVGRSISPFFLHFDHSNVGDGPMGYMVEDRHLRGVLLDHLERSGVAHMAGKTVVSQQVTPSGISVTTDTGKCISGRVLIGADGSQSGTAKRAGLKRVASAYDQKALVCAVEHDHPHNGVAHQLFTPTGPIAILPLAGGHHSSIVWSETIENAHAIQNMEDADYLNALHQRIGSFLGDMRLFGNRYAYPLTLIMAHAMIADRVALIGDAAHTVHPIAGQGLNAGLKDVAALAEVLVQAHRLGLDIGSSVILEHYQTWRRFDVATLGMATDGFNRLYSNNSSILRALRGVGMGLVARLPRLRDGFMREAMGATGDVPKLLKGISL